MVFVQFRRSRKHFLCVQCQTAHCAQCYVHTKAEAGKATTRPKDSFSSFPPRFPVCTSKAQSERARTCFWEKFSRTTRRPIRPVDFVICDASEQQSLPLVWLAMILTEVAHKRTTALAAIRIVPMKS